MIRTAVIGVGNMGKNHVRVYSEISKLVAVADVIPEIGRPIAEKFCVPYYQNYEEMLTKEKPDAVSVVVPTKYHHPVTLECLKRNIPTLVEKPIAATIKEAEEMIAVAKHNKVALMVGHVERFNPAIIKLKKLIDEKKLGKIVSLLSIRVGLTPPKIPNSDVALDLGIHDVDIFNYLVNDFPISHKIHRQKVFNGSFSDSASIMLEYKGVVGFIQTNWITPVKMRRLYVTGTEGFAEVDYINQEISLFDKILITKQNGDYLDLVSLSREPKKEVYVSKKEPLKEELLFFINNRNKSVEQNNRFALEALKIVRE